MKIIAIDPGYDRLGIAILEKNNRKDRLVFSDCLTSSKKDDFYARLGKILSEAEEIFEKFEPKALAIESLFFSNNQKTAMRVAEVRGALIALALKRKMRVFEYTPNQVKVAVTGSGRSDKKQIANLLPKLIEFQKIPKNDDEYDAIAVGLTCLVSEKKLST